MRGHNLQSLQSLETPQANRVSSCFIQNNPRRALNVVRRVRCVPYPCACDARSRVKVRELGFSVCVPSVGRVTVSRRRAVFDAPPRPARVPLPERASPRNGFCATFGPSQTSACVTCNTCLRHYEDVKRTREGEEIMLACNGCWCGLDTGNVYIAACDHVYCKCSNASRARQSRLFVSESKKVNV